MAKKMTTTGDKKASRSNNQKQGNKKNKTMLIVLAVAISFIGLSVIMAIPSSMKTEKGEERDRLRLEDLMPIITAVNNYMLNNRGKIPEATMSAWDKLLDDKVGVLKDGANGLPYRLTEVCTYGDSGCTDPDMLTWANNERQIYVIYGAKCSGLTEAHLEKAAKAKTLAVITPMEYRGNLCVNN